MSSICSSPSVSLNEEVVVRKRNALACVECNRRKKKCVQDQGSHSCYYCSSKSIQCRFPSRPVKRTRKKVEADLKSLTSEDYSLVEDNDYQTKSIMITNQEGSSNATMASSSETKRERSPLSPSSHHLRGFTAELPSPKSPQSTIEVQHWTNSTFITQNSRESWVEAYFSKVYKYLPLLSKQWLIESIMDIPVALLHVMYACSLITKSPNVATTHYKQALKMIYEDFEKADLMTIVTFLHFHYFEGDSDIASLHFSNAVKFAILLELDKSCSYSWISPNGNLMGY